MHTTQTLLFAGLREKTKSSLLPLVTPIQVESHVFPPTVKPPGMAKSFFLGGAGLVYFGLHIISCTMGYYSLNLIHLFVHSPFRSETMFADFKGG